MIIQGSALSFSYQPIFTVVWSYPHPLVMRIFTCTEQNKPNIDIFYHLSPKNVYYPTRFSAINDLLGPITCSITPLFANYVSDF